MMSIGFAALVQAAVLVTGADSESYADAHERVMSTGQPMVVMVGADWCPACQVMKNQVLPRVRERGILAKVAFAIVNLDRERELGAQLTNNGPIPQLLMYRKTSAGWRLRRLIGGQSEGAVESFIDEGIAADQQKKQPEATQPQKPPAKFSSSAPHDRTGANSSESPG